MERYIQVLEDMIKLFEEMIPLEKTKMSCVTTHNLSLLEEIMKKEQAGVMRMKGLEQKRMKIQTELGFDTKTFRQIIDLSSGEYSGQLKDLYTRMNETVGLFKSANESCSQLLELSLHNIDKQIIQLKEAHHMDASEDLSTLYGQKNAPAKNISFHSRTV